MQVMFVVIINMFFKDALFGFLFVGAVARLPAARLRERVR